MHTQEKYSDRYEYSFPNGWLIKAFRYLNIPSKDHEQAINLFDEMYQNKLNRQNQAGQEAEGASVFIGSRKVAYGNYDRIQITPVDDLFDFTREANQTHDWLGSNQSILLFKWKKGRKQRRFSSIVEKGTKKAKIGVLDEAEKVKENEFFAVTFCYISDDMRNRRMNSSYTDILERCEHYICSLVKAFNERLSDSGDTPLHSEVCAEVFGSLSAAEIVIFWSAKQYTDVMYLIDCIRDFRYKWKQETVNLFRTTYTLISFPHAENRDIEKKWDGMRDPSLRNILGEATIQFATQDGAGEETFAAFESFFRNCIQNASEMLGEPPPKNLIGYVVLENTI